MNNIFIPKKINVGYQNRSGTYTGKLAYIIYYDQRGKLRKETSWQNWRDQSIPNDEFDNVPTTGFVLNKKVGDYSSGWDHRHAYCRVYDPRNFEFEITIENLLYILENTSSIKGKGLEGEFVYGWDGKDLILMPVGSPDYKQISEYNEIVRNKMSVKAKDLIVGATYLSKDNTQMIYMGKFDYYDQDYYDHHITEQSKMYWFAYQRTTQIYDRTKREYVDTGKVWDFQSYKNLSGNKFIKCINEVCTLEYSDIFEKLEFNCHYSPYDKSKDEFILYTLDEFIKMLEAGHTDYTTKPNSNLDSFHYEIRTHDNMYICNIPWEWRRNEDAYKEDYNNRFRFEKTEKPRYSCWSSIREYEYRFIPINIEELYERLQPCYQIKHLQNGNEYERRFYYVGEEK